MMRKILSVILSLLMIAVSLPTTAFAASAQVNVINGENTVFLSSFGKITYSKTVYPAFKKFGDAANALGANGGTIILSGTTKVGDFADIDGRKDISVKGAGVKATANIIDYTGKPVIELAGGLCFDNVQLRTDANAFIVTGGKSFATSSSVLAEGAPSVVVGKSAGDAGTVALQGGNFATVAAGSYNGGTVEGNTNVVIGGGNYEKVVAGGVDGTVNGNVFVTVNGGTVKSAVIGPEASAVNGNVVLAVNADSIEAFAAGAGAVSGKKIVIGNAAALAKVPAGAADYIITVESGICVPVFDGTTIKGFAVSDANGISVNAATINGKAATAENGIFALAEGKNTVSVNPVISVALNKNANYVAGYEDGTFRPQNNVTRAEAVVMLSRIVADENSFKGKVTSDFADVEPGSWYESYIGLFEHMGLLDLVSTWGGSRFEPSKKITRAEFAQLIYEINTLGTVKSTKLAYVPDVEPTSPFYPAASNAVASGIVTGYEDGTFRPDNSITRAEVVTMVNRLLGRVPTGNAGTVSFGDTASHWANGQVLAACNPEGTAWTPKQTPTEYSINGTTAKEYVIGLYDQSKDLSSDAIMRGIDIISQQMKKDVLETPNTADIYGDKMTGQIYYISEKNGNDDNDGKTPETAWKTPAAITKVAFHKKNTTFLFERGGVYRGNISVNVDGTILGSYGTGEKPVIMQSRKNYADPALWVETEWENVWKCTEALHDVGVIGFDHDLFDHTDDAYNELFGDSQIPDAFGFTGDVAQMNTDLQYYSVLDNSKDGKLKTGELYLYSASGNPGSRFKSIEIGEDVAIVSGRGDDVIIDNISFKFTGGHGMGGAGGCKNRTVTNCIYSWIGGSVLSLTTLYGNAIEIYGDCDGYFVENNWIYQIYDTAITHQFNEEGACIHQNVRYYGNLIEYCYWGIEFYNRPGPLTPASRKYTKDVHIAYNVLNHSGYGWGSAVSNREGFAYCGTSLATNSDQLTEYNVINGCSGWIILLTHNSTETDDKNFYIQEKGRRIGNLKATSNVVCDYDAAYQIGKHLGDENAVVIVLEPEEA